MILASRNTTKKTSPTEDSKWGAAPLDYKLLFSGCRASVKLVYFIQEFVIVWQHGETNYRFCLAYIDKHIYMLGGYCEDEGFTASVVRYSEADDCWDAVVNMPRALRYVEMFLYLFIQFLFIW